MKQQNAGRIVLIISQIFMGSICILLGAAGISTITTSLHKMLLNPTLPVAMKVGPAVIAMSLIAGMTCFAVAIFNIGVMISKIFHKGA